jgi:hypothetical protein
VFLIKSYAMARTRSQPIKVFCDLDAGGWTLLMKTSESEAFQYDSKHWTQPTVLNAQDVSVDDGDAKFQVFNELDVQEFMAVWPDSEGSVPWQVGPYSASTTALQFFQTPRVLDTRPSERSDFNRRIFSSQNGAQQLGIAHETPFSRVRWGYSWNDQQVRVVL